MVSYFANGNGMAFLGQVLILVVVEDDLVLVAPATGHPDCVRS